MHFKCMNICGAMEGNLYGNCGNYVVISFKYLAVFASYTGGVAIRRMNSMRLVHHVSKVRDMC